MKLSRLTELIKKKTNKKDPEIKIVGDGGFLDISEVLNRDDYYDENFFGSQYEKGDFICIEVEKKSIWD